MNSTVKRKSVFGFVAALAAFVLGALALLTSSHSGAVTADTENNIGLTYYYDELGNSELAQKFYSVISDMAKNGALKNGTSEYDLSDVLTQEEISGYVDSGLSKIPVAFSSARDAFYMDNPDLFYADVYKLYFTAGMQNGRYVAFINSGNADNYFLNGTINSETEVNSAVTLYENEIKKIVNDAKAAGDAIKQIEYVNKYICDNVKYDYDKRESNDYTGYVSTAYGALVEKKAMCGGYSRAFKAVLDRLGIPCVLVQGYVSSESKVPGLEPGYTAHMWNAVQLDGLWYGVDTTYNAGCGNIKKYLLVGNDLLSQDHFEDSVISSSGFELRYPALRPFDYGVSEDRSGFKFKDSGNMIVDGEDTVFGYEQYSSGGRDITTLTLGVSYNGKDARMLGQDGLYLAYRYYYKTGDVPHSAWIGVLSMNQITEEFKFADGYTCTWYNESLYKVQFAVIDYAPDVDPYGGNIYIAYNEENFDSDHLVAVSSIYRNDAYGTYFPAPRVTRTTPSSTGFIMSLNAIDATFTYSEKLVYEEGKDSSDLGISVTGLNNDNVEKYVKVENIKWDEETNTLSFRFTPSLQFIHNCEVYNLVPTCLIGEVSKKEPEPGSFSFKRKQVVCPKVFNDGRLYMQVYGYPEFVGAEDMSLTEFKDANGQPVAGNQRSQLMLVVNEVGKEESDEMMDALLSDEELGIEQSDIKSSSTYQIDLQLCGLVQKVPNGSYMQVGFGFPDNYGPEDKGVTFTVYHYTRNPDGSVKSVEQIPCVVTEYGIIATVKSFSPFMICAVDSSKVTTKSIYASVSGVGGSIDQTLVKTVAEGKSVTYTLKADNGYKINSVMLNGKSVIDNVGDNGVITIPYSELTGYNIGENANPNSNVLEVTFVSERVAKSYADRGITVASPKIVVTDADLIIAKPHEVAAIAPGSKNHTGLIVGIVVAIIVLACAGVAVYLIFRNKKKTEKKAATRSTSVKTTETVANKPAAKSVTSTRPTNAGTARSTTSTARSAAPASPTKPSDTSHHASTRPASTAAPTRRPVSRNDEGKNKK